MRMFYDEISRQFPELRGRFSEGDEELPYVVIGYLIDWITELPKDAITAQLIERLVLFARWCEAQPRGKDAGDDLFTVLTVGFYEKLFESETTRALVPHFISREQFVEGGNYLRTWVGVENYEKAGKYYEPPV